MVHSNYDIHLKFERLVRSPPVLLPLPRQRSSISLHRPSYAYCYSMSTSHTRVFLGKPKPAALGVGTDRVYCLGLCTEAPSWLDRLVAQDGWNPIVVLPTLLTAVQAKIFQRAMMQEGRLYTTFIIFWKEVREPSLAFALRLTVRSSCL